MASNRSEVKRRVEEKYEYEEPSVDASNDHAGKMTVGSCSGCGPTAS